MPDPRIKPPKTGWNFQDKIPEDSIPVSLAEIILASWKCGHAVGFSDGLGCMYMRPSEKDVCVVYARQQGLVFRLREIHYDALHGLGPLGPILMAEREKEA